MKQVTASSRPWLLVCAVSPCSTRGASLRAGSMQRVRIHDLMWRLPMSLLSISGLRRCVIQSGIYSIFSVENGPHA